MYCVSALDVRCKYIHARKTYATVSCSDNPVKKNCNTSLLIFVSTCVCVCVGCAQVCVRAWCGGWGEEGMGVLGGNCISRLNSSAEMFSDGKIKSNSIASRLC